MKKSTKKLARHLTALFAALAVGLGTLPAAAFAADAPEPIPEQPAIVGVESAQEEGQSDAVGTDTAGTGETETGETGTDETGTDAVGTDETGTDETGTGETIPSEDAVLPTEPATQPEQPEETPAAGEAPDAEEIPAEVEAFLNAVAKIPADITPDNAEEAAELVFGEVSEAYEALLGTEYEGRADVQEAAALYAAAIEAVDAALDMESTHYLASIPGFKPADRFYDNKGKEVAQLYVGTYPNNPVYSYGNPATSIEVKVGESGFEQYLYTKSAICHCGNVLVEVTPDWIAVDSNRKLTNSDSSIIKDLSWNLAGYIAEDESDEGYEGYPALRLNVVGAKPGNTQIKAQVYQNYYYYYTWQRCRRCGQMYSEISFKGKWIEDTQTLNVNVNADYVLNYNANGGSPTPSPTKQTVAKTSADLAVTTAVPDKAGFKFVGWAENAQPAENDRIFKAGDKITLNWEEGKGSQENPVSKTLYAVWKEEGDNTPDAPEKTDLYGILKDFVQVKCVSEGDDLPHEPKSYCTLGNANEVTIGKVESRVDESDGNSYYYCDVILHGEEYVKFYGMEPDFGTGVKHTIKLAEGEKADQIITLKWNADVEKWQSGSPKGTILATFKAVCVEPKYAVKWIDAANDAVLKSENRTGTVGTTVTVNENDKAYPGYTYVGDEDARNVLS
ncbi:MAG: InlB B-repeat-containing protein, partial [Oscillospiraceae bacterium]|nr:InlB B-repeat-containing protein [Oscillospiraceae bacterium]